MLKGKTSARSRMVSALAIRRNVVSMRSRLCIDGGWH
jgi:hypothetical protein